MVYNRQLTRAAWVGRLEELAVGFDSGAQLQCLVVHIYSLNRVAEAEIRKYDVEDPQQRFGLLC